jgi:hypothetical protein
MTSSKRIVAAPTECIRPGCGRPIGSKGDPHHEWSCGKTQCDAYAKGVEDERARIVKALRDEVNGDRTVPKPTLAAAIIEGVMTIAKGTILGLADRLEAGMM